MARRTGFLVVDGRVVDDPTSVDRPTFAERQVPATRAEAVGERLLALSPERAASVPLQEVVREALALAREVRTHGARRRQRLYLAKLLRAEELDAIEVALDAGPVDPMISWRERLLEGGDEVVEQFVAEHPGADRQRIRTRVRGALKAAAGSGKRDRALSALLELLHEAR